MKIFKKNKINFKSGFTPPNLSAGFTFMELVVVIAIFGIMGSILMFNYRDFSANVGSKNLASNIALNIKKAQTLALSGDVKYGYNYDVSGSPFIGVSDFGNRKSPTYGIFFAKGENIQSIADGAKSFMIFRDKNFNGLYNSISGDCLGGISTECVEEVTIETRDKITKFCVDVDIPGSQKCSSDANSSIKGLAITFRRPYPDAIITLQGATGTKLSTNHQNAQITISSESGLSARVINITNLGQISVK